MESCKYCGSTEGFYVKYMIRGTRPYYFDFDGEPTENNLEYNEYNNTKEGKFAYCSHCNKCLGRAEKIFDEIRDQWAQKEVKK
jgi:hypothetical protein